MGSCRRNEKGKKYYADNCCEKFLKWGFFYGKLVRNIDSCLGGGFASICCGRKNRLRRQNSSAPPPPLLPLATPFFTRMMRCRKISTAQPSNHYGCASLQLFLLSIVTVYL